MSNTDDLSIRKEAKKNTVMATLCLFPGFALILPLIGSVIYARKAIKLWKKSSPASRSIPFLKAVTWSSYALLAMYVIGLLVPQPEHSSPVDSGPLSLAPSTTQEPVAATETSDARSRASNLPTVPHDSAEGASSVQELIEWERKQENVTIEERRLAMLLEAIGSMLDGTDQTFSDFMKDYNKASAIGFESGHTLNSAMSSPVHLPIHISIG